MNFPIIWSRQGYPRWAVVINPTVGHSHWALPVVLLVPLCDPYEMDAQRKAVFTTLVIIMIIPESTVVYTVSQSQSD